MKSPFHQQHFQPPRAEEEDGEKCIQPLFPVDLQILHPLVFADEKQQLQVSSTISPQCLISDLSVSRIDRIHRHLWWAGRPQAARPLHKQQLLRRQIAITEQADLHLLWTENRIFIKPLPPYILDTKVWDEYICKSPELYANARGIPLSYIWLIRHKSDFDIAKEHNLFPEGMTWKTWFDIVADIKDSFDDLQNPQDVSKRYDFGELRISRINQITRLRALRALNVYGFINGHMQSYTYYKSFFDANFRWIIVAFAFGSVLLSAFQVGLATEELKSKKGFQSMSVGFSMFLVAAPLFLVAFPLVLFISLYLYFLVHTLRFNKKRFGNDEKRKGVGHSV
jgi:hypothetical protein